MNWQPIETAPKDGEHIVIAADNGNFVICHSAYWERDTIEGGGGWVELNNYDIILNATHWLPFTPPEVA